MQYRWLHLNPALFSTHYKTPPFMEREKRRRNLSYFRHPETIENSKDGEV